MSKISCRDHKVKKRNDEVLDASTSSATDILSCARVGMSVVDALTATRTKSSHVAVDD